MGIKYKHDTQLIVMACDTKQIHTFLIELHENMDKYEFT